MMTSNLKVNAKVNAMQSRQFKYFISILLMLCVAKLSFAEIINHEDAIETNEIILVGTKTNGFVLARKCAKCPQLRLQLSPNTKAYAQGQQVPMSSVPNRLKTAITVIYDPKTNVVNRIKW